MAKWRRKPKKKTDKQIAWDWMSRWVRITAVIETCEQIPTLSPLDLIAQCCTCGKLSSVRKKGGIQAGHYKARGIGGGSGTYFDERNIGPQCGSCNGFEGGRPEKFREYLVEKYDEETVQDLERLHKLPSRWGPRQYPGLILHYKVEVSRLLEETGIKKWW